MQTCVPCVCWAIEKVLSEHGWRCTGCECEKIDLELELELETINLSQTELKAKIEAHKEYSDILKAMAKEAGINC